MNTLITILLVTCIYICMGSRVIDISSTSNTKVGNDILLSSGEIIEMVVPTNFFTENDLLTLNFRSYVANESELFCQLTVDVGDDNSQLRYRFYNETDYEYDKHYANGVSGLSLDYSCDSTEYHGACMDTGFPNVASGYALMYSGEIYMLSSDFDLVSNDEIRFIFRNKGDLACLVTPTMIVAELGAQNGAFFQFSRDHFSIPLDVFENEDYSTTIGNSAANYMNHFYHTDAVLSDPLLNGLDPEFGHFGLNFNEDFEMYQSYILDLTSAGPITSDHVLGIQFAGTISEYYIEVQFGGCLKGNACVNETEFEYDLGFAYGYASHNGPTNTMAYIELGRLVDLNLESKVLIYLSDNYINVYMYPRLWDLSADTASNTMIKIEPTQQENCDTISGERMDLLWKLVRISLIDGGYSPNSNLNNIPHRFDLYSISDEMIDSGLGLFGCTYDMDSTVLGNILEKYYDETMVNCTFVDCDDCSDGTIAYYYNMLGTSSHIFCYDVNNETQAYGSGFKFTPSFDNGNSAKTSIAYFYGGYSEYGYNIQIDTGVSSMSDKNQEMESGFSNMIVHSIPIKDEEEISFTILPNRYYNYAPNGYIVYRYVPVFYYEKCSHCNEDTTIDCVQFGECSCHLGWTGADCTEKLPNNCDLDPCLNGGLCVDGACQCNGTGYEGEICQINTDDCVDVDCGNGECLNLVNDYICSCDSGYYGSDCSLVIPENPCHGVGDNFCTNKVQGKCVNDEGAALCVCNSGYYGDSCENEVGAIGTGTGSDDTNTGSDDTNTGSDDTNTGSDGTDSNEDDSDGSKSAGYELSAMVIIILGVLF
eukprot:TRINITY_DN555_c0_g1_i1.p1 TRINITY_DN555_c0_g1~~TRINITY_DN555_c0_g1_i1.p1  ORF type:complete len:819 (-),score=193.31 TRINITY_DN555_c0_g1_i1:44-2500(-)